MGFAGSVSGTLQTMLSYSLEAVGWEHVTTQDVYLPDVPWVAQASLNHFNNLDGSSAWVFEVDGTMYFMNCVYGSGGARVTFALVSGFPATGGFGDSFSQALANIFLFSGDSNLVPTSPPPQDYGGGGDGG